MMLVTREQDDHFMVGKVVETRFGNTGTITTVIEYEHEPEGEGDRERETKTRVIVDLGDREVNLRSRDVEVVR